MIATVVLLLLAFANGANDNFKSVATIYGSRVAAYRTSLAWATLTVFAGAIASAFLAHGLIAAFSGRGLVGPEVASQGRFAAVVALAAGLAVLIASRVGMPVSTTHALVGGLAGVAIVASPGWGWLATLGVVFFLPLITSPILSLALSWMANRLTPAASSSCLCVATVATPQGDAPVTVAGTEAECAAQGAAPLVRASWLLDGVHFASAGAVGFMRGLNDTPKLLGVAAAAGLAATDLRLAFAVALAMAAGGIVGARRVARTMSERLTPMSPGQGTLSNGLTSVIVGAASAWSLPVSTTYVSCGTIFGLGAARRELSRKWAGAVAGAWLFTLPVSALLAGGLWFAFAFLD